MKILKPLITLIFGMLCLTCSLTLQAAGLERWLYCSQNLWVDKNIDDLEALLRRAAKAGYTHVLISDSKFSKLGDMDAHYFRNIDRVKKIAVELRLELVPALFSVGYSNDLLWHDPNLIEGLPVRDALLVASNGVAHLQSEVPVNFKGGDFSDLKLWTWKDDTVVADYGTARITDPRGQNARIVQSLKVQPFRQYHIAVRVKTQDFQGTPEVKILAGNQALYFNHLGAKATQDWQTHQVVFNSLSNTTVNVYFGCWGGTTGSLWWDDATIEEVAFLNLIRREGAPLAIQREDGALLTEGQDFEPLKDPSMGNHPWNGAYDIYHAPPMLKTALTNGTRLRASYYHVVTVYDDQAMICPSEPRTVELLRDQARRMHAAWSAKGYMMSHDEIRVLNWCAACDKRHLDAGAILADNVRTCIQILRDTNPGGNLYVWSDMFDPNHNAHKDYYLVRGDLTGSWDGLDKDVIIVPWYFEKRAATLKFFADRGHRQMIAGYYDSAPEKIRDWLDAAKQVPRVLGVMYTSWERRFSDLEKFGRIVEDYQPRLRTSLNSGQMRLDFQGFWGAGELFAIQTSPDLQLWREWTNIDGGQTVAGISEPAANPDARKFYRARVTR